MSTAAIVEGITGLLGLVVDLVKAGHDPVVAIERVRAELLRGDVQDIRDRREQKQDELFSKPDPHEG
jgi:hypothetical protein